MFDKKSDEVQLLKLKKEFELNFPLSFKFSRVTDIKDKTLRLVKDRITISSLQVNKTIRKRFYKEITILYPND